MVVRAGGRSGYERVADAQTTATMAGEPPQAPSPFHPGRAADRAPVKRVVTRAFAACRRLQGPAHGTAPAPWRGPVADDDGRWRSGAGCEA